MRIEQIAYHRNGIGGVPFYVVLFRDSPDGRDGGRELLFLATVFASNGEDEYASVICLDRIEGYGVTFGENSWKAEHWLPQLKEAIKEWSDQETKRLAGEE